MIFSQTYTARWHETDCNRHMTPSAVLTLMQETAANQWKEAGSDLDSLRDSKGLAFLLSRISIRFLKSIFAYDELTVQTWISPGRGLRFGRCFEILRDGEVVADALSDWGLLNLRNKSLVKYDDFQSPFAEHPAPESNLPLRFSMPALSEMECVGSRPVVWSDLDYNRHMNNTRYPNMLCDFLPDADRLSVQGMTLSFLREASFGHTLQVFRRDCGDGIFNFRTVNEEGLTCLEAVVYTQPLRDVKG